MMIMTLWLYCHVLTFSTEGQLQQILYLEYMPSLLVSFKEEEVVQESIFMSKKRLSEIKIKGKKDFFKRMG